MLYRYKSTHSDAGTAGAHGTLAEGEKGEGDKEETGAVAALRTLTYADECRHLAFYQNLPLLAADMLSSFVPLCVPEV